MTWAEKETNSCKTLRNNIVNKAAISSWTYVCITVVQLPVLQCLQRLLGLFHCLELTGRQTLDTTPVRGLCRRDLFGRFSLLLGQALEKLRKLGYFMMFQYVSICFKLVHVISSYSNQVWTNCWPVLLHHL